MWDTDDAARRRIERFLRLQIGHVPAVEDFDLPSPPGFRILAATETEDYVTGFLVADDAPRGRTSPPVITWLVRDRELMWGAADIHEYLAGALHELDSPSLAALLVADLAPHAIVPAQAPPAPTWFDAVAARLRECLDEA